MAQGPYFGKLGEVGVAEILSVLFRNKATGTLDLQHEKDQRRLVLAGGEIRSARSNHMEQRIGYLLVKDGCITQEQLQQGLESKPSSVPLGQFFRQHEAITEEALNAALWHLVQAIIDNCFNWMEGIFRYNPGQAALTKATEILL